MGPPMIVFAWFIGWIFALLGVISRTVAGVHRTSLMVLFPLTLLPDAFVPVATPLSGLERFARVDPISNLITAVGQLAAHGTVGHDFLLSLVGAPMIVAVFAPLTVRACVRKTTARGGLRSESGSRRKGGVVWNP